MSHEESFKGKIGRTMRDSEPWWPEPKRSDDGSPNVVIILFDDAGFSQFGCYGSDIDTPNIDRLAAGGIRYNNYHTTALCSPTRACLLTGRNHHTVGMRVVSNIDSGYPNTRGHVTPHAATIADILREDGYATFATGKWHLAPMEEASTAGPTHNWPLNKGFDRFYGFMQGEADQFYPELTYDNHYIDTPAGPDEGYHISEDLVDQAMGFIRDLKSFRPDRPYFLYVPFGAVHAPHQAPRAYLDKYRGKFDEGWDVAREKWFKKQLDMGLIPPDTELAPHNPGVKPWDELSENEKKFAARLQEAFAAFMDHTDAQIGRLVDFIEGMGDLDNTIIMVMSDNGASQEGGPTGVMDEFRYFNNLTEDVDAIQDRLDEIGGPHSHSNYPWGWAQAGNTPLKWYKQNTFGGGVRDPLIIHWPEKIKDKGGIRGQFHHVTDIAPTLYELLGIEMPDTFGGYDQIPIAGTSMAYTFDDQDAPTKKEVQYFEMFGHRGLWADGWKAVTYHHMGHTLDDDVWELYHLDEDFSEIHNVADQYPEKLQELIELWWAEAGKHGVLPVDDQRDAHFGSQHRKGTPHSKRHYTYYPPVSHVPSEVAPTLGSRSWDMVVDIERGAVNDQGVLFVYGTQNQGVSLFIKDNHLMFDYNIFTNHHVVRSDLEIPVGRVSVGAQFRRKGSEATITLQIDNTDCGSIDVPFVIRMMSSTGMDIGLDRLSPVSDEYKDLAPFAFTGEIHQLDIDLLKYRPPGEADEEAAARFKAEMAKQ